MTNDPQEYDIARIRELLTAAFTPQELRRFCRDRPTFSRVCDAFGPGMGLADMVDAVIEYCHTHFLFDELLTEVERERPGPYMHYKPYIHEREPPPSPPLPVTKPKPTLLWLLIVGAMLFILFVLIVASWALKLPPFKPTPAPGPTPTPTCPPDSSRYGFESADISWVAQTYPDSQGVIAVSRSDSGMSEFGCYSLKLTVDIEGGHENRSKGEAYVEIDIQSLLGKPITVWVYVPEGAFSQAGKQNGIQVFVKDAEDRGEYGTWWDITREKVNGWHQITLTPDISAPPRGSMSPGFDPTLIKAVGVKVAIGEGSKATYSGPIYVDAVDWP